MHVLHQRIQSVCYQLWLNSAAKSLLAGLSVGALTSLTDASTAISVGLGTLVSLLLFSRLGGFNDQRPAAMRLLHRQLTEAEYSLPLLTKSNPNLAEQLQLERLAGQIQVAPRPVVVFAGLLPFALLLGITAGVVGLVAWQTNKPAQSVGSVLVAQKPTVGKKIMSRVPPRFQSASVRVDPPAYTELPARTATDLNISAYVGSVLSWQVQVSQLTGVAVRLVNSRGDELPFVRKAGGVFRFQDRLLNPGLYALRVYWQRRPQGLGSRDSLVYQSDYYRLDARPDIPPTILPAAKTLYTTHRLTDPTAVRLTARIADDFRVKQAFMVATLARGSGENVKFRESRFPVTVAGGGSGSFRSAQVAHTLDLAKLGFAPGDELYYYWAAIDNRLDASNRPDPQLTKSDTYFIVFKDTAQTNEAELATMAVNIMPDYFRSQRQIIIDTDKLIAKRKHLTAKVFSAESNEIGFDQKVLRLRYGQYMGEEFENQIGGHTPLPDNDAHMLDGYMHKHDTEKEKGGDVVKPFAFKMAEEVEKKAANAETGHAHDEHGPKNGEEKDPLAALMEQYVHSHDNGEVNTFYEQSTRSLLKMALEQMWQSELHLRLYEPEKARPFELKALEYLKTAQQKARAYAKKSGYDPPPLKEKETRLTGELGDAPEQHRLARSYANVPVATLVAEVLGLLELPSLTVANRQRVSLLNAALSGPLLKSGLLNWSVLASLQKLAGGQRLPANEVARLQTKLTAFAPCSSVGRPAQVADKRLENAFWRAMRP